MGSVRNTQFKQLTATGAVTTDNVGGILYKVYGSCDTAGASIIIKDGATTIGKWWLTQYAPIVIEPPKDKDWTFATDIDTTIDANSGTVSFTFIFAEVTV